MVRVKKIQNIASYLQNFGLNKNVECDQIPYVCFYFFLADYNTGYMINISWVNDAIQE